MLRSRREEASIRIEAKLRAVADLDRSYYANPNASLAERAVYYRRQEYVEALRKHFYLELESESSSQDQGQVFRVQIDDRANHRQVTSAPLCRQAHDLNNLIGVALGNCQLLEESGIADPEQVKQRAAKIAASLRRIAEIVKEACRSCQS